MDAAEVPGILDAVYKSALFPGHWPHALDQLGQAFDCTSVALIDRNLRTLEGRVSASGVDASSQREFLDLWSARDIVRLRTRSWRPGAIELDHHIVPRPELLASDYYNGFMKPRDMRTVMRLTLAHQNQIPHHHQSGTAAFRRGFRRRRDRAVPGADAASAARVHDPVPCARRRLYAGRAFRCRRPLDRGDAVAGAGREGEIRQQGGAHDGGRRRRLVASGRSVRSRQPKRRCRLAAPHRGSDGRAAGGRRAARRRACDSRAVRARRATP